MENGGLAKAHARNHCEIPSFSNVVVEDHDVLRIVLPL